MVGGLELSIHVPKRTHNYFRAILRACSSFSCRTTRRTPWRKTACACVHVASVHGENDCTQKFTQEHLVCVVVARKDFITRPTNLLSAVTRAYKLGTSWAAGTRDAHDITHEGPLEGTQHVK